MSTSASDLQTRLRAATRLHQAGDYDRARPVYESILRAVPGHPETSFRLGDLSLKQQRAEEALELFRIADHGHPSNPRYLNGIGKAQLKLGRFADAEAAFLAALEVDPGYRAALLNLGRSQRLDGRPGAAIDSFRRVLANDPGNVAARLNQGNALVDSGRLEEARHTFEQVLEAAPELGEAHLNLAAIDQLEGELESAQRGFERALELSPRLAGAHLNLAQVLLARNDAEGAEARFRALLELDANNIDSYLGLGRLAHRRGDDRSAAAHIQRALAIDPEHVESLLLLGRVLMLKASVTAARQFLERALKLDPDRIEAWCDLADLDISQGRLEQGRDRLMKAQELDPDRAETAWRLIRLRADLCDWSSRDDDQSKLLELADRFIAKDTAGALLPPLDLSCFLAPTPELHLAFARRYAEATAERLSSLAVAECPTRRPGAALRRRLRIGYISPDFRQHAVGILVHDLFRRHDRSRFEIFAYSLVPSDDRWQQGIRSGCDHFTDLSMSPIEQAARQIHRDEIDILVDLAGYTTHCRSEILALRPAPIQVMYLGYPDTSGSAWIDYLLADEQLVPKEMELHYSEKIVRLRSHFVTAPMPIPTDPPSRTFFGLPESGPVLCCFNAHYKFEPVVFGAWMRILERLGDAVLWLGDEASSPSPANLRSQAAARGIDPKRLVFAQRSDFASYLARYQHCDLFLDTFGYCAGSTAVCALWAGTPVLTLVGTRNASRMGASICAAAGLEEMIVDNLADYEERAVELVQDPCAIAELKSRLDRSRDQSPLFDPDRFVAGLEAVYTEMWRRWQTGKSPESFEV